MEKENCQLLNVSITDDHKMVVESLSKTINESDIARVSGRYYDLKSCREGLKKEKTDILLLDIELPDGDGVEFCAEVKKMYPDIKIIMLTSYKEFNVAKRALLNGALGYILKNADCEEIFAGIEIVSRGEQFLCEEIDILLKQKKNTDVIWLTSREKEVLKHTANGLTAEQTGELMFINTETVKTYRKNVLIKLQAKNVAEAIKIASKMNLL